MIPKTIHYCWFGRNPKPKLAVKCIKSWKKYCPDYEIIEWNEDNFDLSACPLYVRQAYEAKKWAFVTDYVRLKVVYEHGGIYFDTDVEVKRNLDDLLQYHGFFGFEDGIHINTGLGFGAVKGAPILSEMMVDYEYIPFVMPDGTFDTTSCPKRNTAVLLRHGLEQNNLLQELEKAITIFPTEYFCPKSPITGVLSLTQNTYTIHHFDASWLPEEQKLKWKSYWKEVARERRQHLPNRIAIRLLGQARYDRVKKLLGR